MNFDRTVASYAEGLLVKLINYDHQSNIPSPYYFKPFLSGAHIEIRFPYHSKTTSLSGGTTLRCHVLSVGGAFQRDSSA